MRLNRRVGRIMLAVIIIAAASAGYFRWEKSRPAPAPLIEGTPGYDVIVIGGEPEGVAAAVSAARNGLKTLLIEDDAALGGLMTLGELNFLDMNYGPKNELLTQGIFREFFKAVGNAFDVEQAKAWFLNTVKAEKNLTLKLNIEVLEPIFTGNSISGVRVKENGQPAEYRALRVIDATTDAEVAVMAGVPYTLGGEDYGEEGLLMGVTLVFEVSGVDWQRVIQYLKHEDADPHSGADQVAAWGYGKEAMDYEPVDKMMRFRGPNIARQKNGNVLINALLIFGVDGLDPASKAAGIERGKQEIPHIVEFMREKFPGFEEAGFVRAAEQLYIRETRHIVGEYRLTITDVLENKDQWDRIAHGSYPVDVQPTSPGNYGNVIGKPEIYSIPFRSIVPLKVDNLLVVGRSASFDSLPHGSARVIPVGMATGEAAGVASAWSIEQETTFRQMSTDQEAITWVQNRLKKQGAYLVEYESPQPEIMKHWAYPGVRVMRELGLIEGGYENNYGLERKVNKWNVQNKLNKVLRVAAERNTQVVPRKLEIPEKVSGEVLAVAVAEGMSGESLGFEEALSLLQEKGIITPELEKHVTDWQDTPDFAAMLTILADLYTYLLQL